MSTGQASGPLAQRRLPLLHQAAHWCLDAVHVSLISRSLSFFPLHPELFQAAYMLACKVISMQAHASRLELVVVAGLVVR